MSWSRKWTTAKKRNPIKIRDPEFRQRRERTKKERLERILNEEFKDELQISKNRVD